MKLTLDYKKYAQAARQMAAEGCVLLENKNETLPIRPGECVSVFGRIQHETYYCGTGSGGLVNPPYVVTILEGLRAQCSINEELLQVYLAWIARHPFDVGTGWAQQRWSQEEMPVSLELARKAASQSDLAVVVIGRTAGEDQDSAAEPGAYYLSEKEELLLKNVCAAFDRVAVILNVGGIMDMSWVDQFQPGAVMYTWQGGCEGGNAVADVLTGRINPSGCLPDTVAKALADYPAHTNFGSPDEIIYQEDIYVGYRYFETFAQDRVKYPFGYGLSYTTFSCTPCSCRVEAEQLHAVVRVENTGAVAGKQTLQLYSCPPQGRLGKAARNLIGFSKTELLQPGESAEVCFTIGVSELSSYDDSGKTGHPYAWVLEQGAYTFYAGFDVRSAKKIGTWTLAELTVVATEEQAMAPIQPFERLIAGEKVAAHQYAMAYEAAPVRTYDLAVRMKPEMEQSHRAREDHKYLWADVCGQRATLQQFLDQFSDEELICMTRGEGMCSAKVTPGTASAFGGVTEVYQAYGIPACCCADGPSGIRMDCGAMAFSIPNGTAIASSFNEVLTQRLFSYMGLELVKNKVDTLLGPGINIHRYPLCGRNFEYFSEDPLLSGNMAVAELAGMHPLHVTGTIKHFACNNQEFHRRNVNAVVSERAIREIYLKAFEIAVKKGNARSIMTSYNPINGIWTASSYDLLTTILRKEWGYTGMVMTDWWAELNDVNGEPTRTNTAAMIRAQNDIYMVAADAAANSNGDNTMEALASGRLTRGEVMRSVRNICNVILQSNASMSPDCNEEMVILHQPSLGKRICSGKIYELNRETVILELPASTQRGVRASYSLRAAQPGRYCFSYRFHTCPESEVAQIPVSIFKDDRLLKTITLQGTTALADSLMLEMPAAEDAVLELYFGDTGLFVDELYINHWN